MTATPYLLLTQSGLLANKGSPVFCPEVPDCAECCAGFTFPMYIWGTFYSGGNPFPPASGSGTVPAHYGVGDGFWNAFCYGSNLVFTVLWNAIREEPGVYSAIDVSTTDCTVTLRFSSKCAEVCGGSGFHWLIGVGSCIPFDGAGFPYPTGYTSVVPAICTADVGGSDCVVPAGCLTGAQPVTQPHYVNYYFTTRNPTRGILCPDSSIIGTTLTFTVTNAFGPFVSNLVFSPLLQVGLGDGTVTPFGPFNLFLTSMQNCYTWFAHYGNCDGHRARVALYFDGTNWNLLYGDPGGPGTAVVLYSNPALPTTGVMGTADSCSGPTDTWTITYPMLPAAVHAEDTPRLPSPSRTSKSNLCPKCGIEMTKLVLCDTCKGRVQVKVCPNCD